MADKTVPLDALTVRAGITAVCPKCGVTMGEATTSCDKCGAVLTQGADAEATEKLRARLQEAVGENLRLVELLGRGGMGIVFRAHEVSLDREVALKVLALDPILNPDAFARFEREAKLAAKLDHPNIVPIFSVGRSTTVAYYTMRLVKGGNVEDLIGNRRQLDFDQTIRILRDVAAALDYAHAQGVVHRDIKPANILLGDKGHAMVADFGIAKALGADGGARQTSTGIIGSPGYMSPEQWRGEELTGRADQYALGIVAFEMLSGRRPFETESIQDLVKLHIGGDIPDITRLRPGLDPSVNDAIGRALAKFSHERYGSATAFVETLAGKRPITLGTASTRVPRYEPKAPPPKKKKPVGLVLFSLLAAGLVTLHVLPSTSHAMAELRHTAVRRFQELTGLQPADAPVYVSQDVPAIDTTPILGPDTLSALGTTPLDTTGVRAGLKMAPVPMTMDTTLYPGGAAPFRRAPVAEYGYVRLIVRGGVAQAIVDGQSSDAMVGPDGHVLRVDIGEHYVTVRGAGDLYTPSQYHIRVSANDTVTALFRTPDVAQEEAGAAAAKSTPPDSVKNEE